MKGWIVGAWLVTATAAGAVDTPPSTDLPDLSAIRAAIYSGEYKTALADLTALTETVKHADLFNLLGYTNRQLGRYEDAAKWYTEALYYDPSHRPALEYQGELFLKIGDIDGAKQNLSLLELFCPDGCAERELLAKAIAQHGHGGDAQ